MPPFSFRSFVSICVFTLTAGQAFADSETCYDDPAQWMAENGHLLEGTWVTQSGAGSLSMGGQSMVLPVQNEAFDAIITWNDGAMEITSSMVQGQYPLTVWAGPRFNYTPGAESEALGKVPDMDELEILHGCSIRMQPQLHSTGTYQEPEGTVEFNLYLTVQSADHMVGVTKGVLNGGQGVARRWITFRK